MTGQRDDQSRSRKRKAESQRDYNSRLQKGGALLDDMRLMVRNWSNGCADGQRDALVAANLLGKKSRARAADTYRRAFRPRFVQGDPANAWRIVRELEDQNLAVEVVRPVYYWITARSERLLYDFVSQELVERARTNRRLINTSDTSEWIALRLVNCQKSWSSPVTKKVAQGLLATLRDFGILEGAAKKRIAPVYLPIESFAYIAFALQQGGVSGSALVKHRDWSLFLLTGGAVEQMFLDADRYGLLRYDAAGNIVRVEFAVHAFKEMADVIARATH